MPQTLTATLPAAPPAVAYLPQVDALPLAQCDLGFTHRAALFVQFHNGVPERRVHRLGASDWDAVNDLHWFLSNRDCRVPDRDAAIKAVEALLATLVRPKPVAPPVAASPVRKTRKARS